MKWTFFKQQYKFALCELINYFAPNGIGVEIGSHQGETSYEILSTTSAKHLYRKAARKLRRL